jgi:PhnB protein
MATKLAAYLNFQGNTKEAMEFYHDALGGELTLTTFKEGNMPTDDPAEQDFIMHADLQADGMQLFAADMTMNMEFKGHNGFALSISGEAADEAKCRDYWDKLSAGGNVTMALDKAPWGDTFGMFTDKYGVGWLVNIAGAVAAEA